MQISATLLGENGTTMIKTRKDFPCPFEEYSCRVLPDWIDANGHMNIALYGVVFDRGNYAACDALDLGEDYVERAQHGVSQRKPTFSTFANCTLMTLSEFERRS